MSTATADHDVDAAVRATPLPSAMLTRRDVGHLFGVDRVTIREWEKAGYLPEPLRIGRKPYWPRETMAEFLATAGKGRARAPELEGAGR
jgi:predicted DNA-binding transcriptional regulator AlpA